MNKKIYLLREDYREKETTGILIHIDNEKTVTTFLTLELPYKNNKRKISCIEKGLYQCVYTYSNKFKKYTYEVKDVPNRSGIRIHAANYFSQLNGCIALGLTMKDINHDGENDTTESKLAIGMFEQLMQREPFELIIL